MPRAGLDASKVIAEAEALANEVGIERVSLAAIAERLGVKVPSLYKHIGGSDDLHARLADRARAGLGDALARAAVGKSAGAALTAIAGAYREWAKANPGTYSTTLRVPLANDREAIIEAERTVETIYSALEGFGLSGTQLVDATRMLRSTLHGFVALEAAGGFGLPRDIDRSFDVAIAALESAISQWPARG